jgi:hypothetical protein
MSGNFRLDRSKLTRYRRYVLEFRLGLGWEIGRFERGQRPEIGRT